MWIPGYICAAGSEWRPFYALVCSSFLDDDHSYYTASLPHKFVNMDPTYTNDQWLVRLLLKRVVFMDANMNDQGFFRILANKVAFLVGHPNGKTSSLQVLRVGGHRCHN